MTPRYLASIEQANTTPDGNGGQSVTWSEALKWWCEPKAVRGREEQRFGRLATVETYVLTGRYDPRITTLHRVNLAGKVMNIRSAQDRDGKRRTLTLECEVGVST